MPDRSMFLDAIALTRTLPCLASPGKIIVIGKPSRPLSDVLPYLAALPGMISYNPDTPSLTFRRPAGFLTLNADRVYVTQVKDVDEGLTLMSDLKDAINVTWDRRLELTAVTERRRAPRLLDVYALLPQTNCKQCGELTCMAFAAGLIQHKRTLAECLSLQTDITLAEHVTTLEALL